MTPTEKIWGTTESLLCTPMFEIHRLVIKPMHRCSLHLHRFKHNAFYVLSGALYIDEVASDFAPVETKMLWPNELYTIGPGIHHQFRSGFAPCTALEMYFTESLSEDIIRRNVGSAL